MEECRPGVERTSAAGAAVVRMQPRRELSRPVCVTKNDLIH